MLHNKSSFQGLPWSSHYRRWMMLLLNSVQLCNHDAFVGNIRTPGTVNIGQEKYSCPDVAYLDNASVGQLHFPWWPHVSLLLNHSLSVRLCSKNFKSITLLSLYGNWWDSYYLPFHFQMENWSTGLFRNLSKVIQLVSANQDLNQEVLCQSSYL